MHLFCRAVPDPPAVTARVEGLWLSPWPGPSVYLGLNGEELTALELSGCLEVIG